MFRLNQKHSKNLGNVVSQADGGSLLSDQSLPAAFLAAVLTVILMNLLWTMSASLLNRVFPWYAILQAIPVGYAVRFAGKGLDWRFPLLAAVMAWAGAYSGNFMLAADTAADEFGTGALHIINNMSEWTLGLYFDEVVTSVDHVYALYSACIAAFLAKRRLNRSEEYALRTHKRDELKQ
jgi:hypothetical protein